MAVGGGHGPARRGGEFLWRMRQRHQSRAGHEPPALFGDHAEGNVPSHAADSAQGVLTDRGKEREEHGLHYRRSAAFKTEAGPATDAGPRKPDQDGNHSGALVFAGAKAPAPFYKLCGPAEARALIRTTPVQSLQAECRYRTQVHLPSRWDGMRCRNLIGF